MVQMSIVEFDYDNNGAPLGLRVREQHNVGPHKVILANKLVSSPDVKELPASVNILCQCKIHYGSVSCSKMKKKYSKDNHFKVKKEITIDLLSLNSNNDSKIEKMVNALKYCQENI